MRMVIAHRHQATAKDQRVSPKSLFAERGSGFHMKRYRACRRLWRGCETQTQR